MKNQTYKTSAESVQIYDTILFFSSTPMFGWLGFGWFPTILSYLWCGFGLGRLILILR